MNLLEFYRSVLVSTGCQVDEDGLISYIGFEKNVPCYIGNLRMILPTKELLDNPDWENFVAFHPLSESNIRGESPVIKKMRLFMNTRITHVLTELMLGLLNIAADTSLHKKLSGPALPFLKAVPVANEKTVKVLGKIFNNIALEGERRVAGIYLKRGGKMEDKNYRRLATVFFPITKSIDDDSKEIFEVKLTAAEKTAITNLFYYILPGANEVDKYSFGSNSDTAPYFHALCGAYINVIRRLNSIVKMFSKHIPDADQLMTDISWEDYYDNLGVYASIIPSLPLNEGDVTDNKGTNEAKPTSHLSHLSNQFTSASEAIKPATVPFQTQQVHQPQVQQQPQQEERTDGKVEWSAVQRANPMLMHNQNPMFMQQQPIVQPAAGDYSGYRRGSPIHGNGFVMNGGGGGYPNQFQNNPAMYRTSSL